MSNPYASPEFASNVTAQPEEKEKLRRIAKYQQWVLYALLLNIVANILIMGSQTSGNQLVPLLILVFVGLPVATVAMAAIFLLAREFYGPAAGVVCAILMLIPCVSLITLLVVNSKATAHLQQRGVKVGLMGANPDTI
jgi:hypothetical protein